MQLLLLIITLLSCTLTGLGQVTDGLFPVMRASTADNREVVLPDDVMGKYTLLILAYSKKSEKALQSWFEPVFYKFVQKTTGLMEGFGYDINVYFVPMFTGINSAATESVKRLALKKVDAEILPYILFYKGDIKMYKERLQLGKGDTPYIFVLDTAGQIAEVVLGEYEEKKMDRIENAID